MTTATATRKARTARTATPTTSIPVVKPASAPASVDVKQSKMEIESTVIPGKLAFAVMTPDRLKALSFISTYTTNDPQSTSPKGHGYQREPMEERFPGIGRYYARGENRFRIPTLMISVRVYDAKGRARFNTLFNSGNVSKIHQEFGKAAFSVIDGQHRIGGLFWAWKNLEDFNAAVPMLLNYGLSYVEEAMLFDDINTSQRKLPKALIEATKVHIQAGEPSHAQTIREVTIGLAEDKDSVWFGKVNMTGAPKSPEPVSFEGLRRSVGDLLPARVITRLEARGYIPANVAKRFWSLTAKACAPAWNEQTRTVENEAHEMVEEVVKYRMKDVVGVAAVSLLGADLLITALDRSTNDEGFWETMSDYVSRLGAVDWEKRKNNPYMATSAGFGGQRQLYEILYALVYTEKEPGEAVEADQQ
jgi:DGQHR domain-containing protein